jgi:hypothetical protein
MTRAKNQVALLAASPLLITESVDEFAALLAALQQEIKPNGIIEQNLYGRFSGDRLGDPAIAPLPNRHRQQRLPGCVAKAAQTSVPDPHILSRIESDASALADDWFTSKRGKKEVLAILRRFDLDEAAIEAEAIRLSWSDLELVDKMQMSLRSRLDKALLSIAAYRDGFAKLVWQSSGLILENDSNDVVRLENFADKNRLDHGK